MPWERGGTHDQWQAVHQEFLGLRAPRGAHAGRRPRSCAGEHGLALRKRHRRGRAGAARRDRDGDRGGDGAEPHRRDRREGRLPRDRAEARQLHDPGRAHELPDARAQAHRAERRRPPVARRVAARGRHGRERGGRGGGLGDQHRGQPAQRPHHGQPDRPDPGQGTRRHDAAAPGARRALRGHRRVARRELRHAGAARERAAPRLEHDHGRRCPRQRGRPDQPHGAADQPRRGRGDQGAAQQLPRGVRPRSRRPDPDREQERRHGLPRQRVLVRAQRALEREQFLQQRHEPPARPLPLQHLGRERRRSDSGAQRQRREEVLLLLLDRGPDHRAARAAPQLPHADRGGARRRLLADPRPERRPDRDPRPAHRPAVPGERGAREPHRRERARAPAACCRCRT